MFNISKFSKWSPFLARQTFFTWCYTGSWICQNDSHGHFRHFELLIDTVTQILTEIYQFQVWPILWPGDVINDVMNTHLHNSSHNLMIHMHRKFNDDIFARFLVIMKNVVISYIKEYRGSTLRPPCDVIDDVIIMKILFWHNLRRYFHILGQIEAVFSISKFSKWPLFWARDKLFYRKLYRKLNIPERWQQWAFPTFWAFDRRSSSNIDGDMSISKFDLLCDLVTSSMTSCVRET